MLVDEGRIRLHNPRSLNDTGHQTLVGAVARDVVYLLPICLAACMSRVDLVKRRTLIGNGRVVLLARLVRSSLHRMISNPRTTAHMAVGMPPSSVGDANKSDLAEIAADPRPYIVSLT